MVTGGDAAALGPACWPWRWLPLMAYLTRKLTAVVVVGLLMILRFDLVIK